MPSLWLQPLKKYADFTGRATRSEYWGFTLVNVLLVLAAMLVMGIAKAVLGGLGSFVVGLLAIGLCLYYLAIIVPSFAVSFRRLHDIDRSAWWILIAFVPFIGGVVLLVFMILDGTAGPNRFGDDPKGRASMGGGSAAVSAPPPSNASEPIVS